MKTKEKEKDLDMERETLRSSKTSLDELLQSIQKDLQQETNHRMVVFNLHLFWIINIRYLFYFLKTLMIKSIYMKN